MPRAKALSNYTQCTHTHTHTHVLCVLAWYYSIYSVQIQCIHMYVHVYWHGTTERLRTCIHIHCTCTSLLHVSPSFQACDYLREDRMDFGLPVWEWHQKNSVNQTKLVSRKSWRDTVIRWKWTMLKSLIRQRLSTTCGTTCVFTSTLPGLGDTIIRRWVYSRTISQSHSILDQIIRRTCTHVHVLCTCSWIYACTCTCTCSWIYAKFSYETPLWWHAVTYGIQLDTLTIWPELHHKYQTYDTCIRILEFSEKIPGLRWESNPHLHNSGVMLYHLSY